MSEANEPKLRSELAPETCWDLTRIYATDEEWEKAFRSLDAVLKEHQACRGHLADSPEALKHALETGDRLGLLLETLYSYAHLKSDEDLSNGKNAGRRDRIAARYAEIEGETSWFDPELLAIPEARFRELEAETVRRFTASAPSPAVVALGGGVISNPCLTQDDRHALGLVVWLDVPVPTAFERMAREGLPPFLADKPDPLAEFERICAVRRPLFRDAADAVLELPEVLPVEEAIDLLLTVLESKVISK